MGESNVYNWGAGKHIWLTGLKFSNMKKSLVKLPKIFQT
jgi:hypothetical protein